MRILITGAAGNLGSILARDLLARTTHSLRLMIHRTPLSPDLAGSDRTEVVRCDLGEPATLPAACEGTDALVHFAGVLFAPRPETFLPITNVRYARNLVDAAVAAAVKRFVLVSFPQVEGPTSAASPCTDRQDRDPVSVHARTRLEAERYLIQRGRDTGMRAIVLRSGMIYGKDVLMIAYARRLARKRMLGVWRAPTPIHLLSIEDFNACCRAAIEREGAEGIYPLGDDAPRTLQDFLDSCCRHWRAARPWRVPVWSVFTVAWVCEAVAAVLRTRTPFTVDFIRIGRVPYVCDTRRMKADLLPALRYPSLEAGLGLL